MSRPRIVLRANLLCRYARTAPDKEYSDNTSEEESLLAFNGAASVEKRVTVLRGLSFERHDLLGRNAHKFKANCVAVGGRCTCAEYVHERRVLLYVRATWDGVMAAPPNKGK